MQISRLQSRWIVCSGPKPGDWDFMVFPLFPDTENDEQKNLDEPQGAEGTTTDPGGRWLSWGGLTNIVKDTVSYIFIYHDFIELFHV